MLARMITSVMTISSSMIVKPSRRSSRQCARAKAYRTLIPIAVFRAIESRALVLGIHVVDVLSAPRRGVRFVLVGPQAPVVRAGRGIDGHAPQEFELPAGGVVRHRDALDQRLQIRREIGRAHV